MLPVISRVFRQVTRFQQRADVKLSGKQIHSIAQKGSIRTVLRAFPTATRSLAQKYTLTQKALAKLQPNIVRVGRYELILAKCK